MKRLKAIHAAETAVMSTAVSRSGMPYRIEIGRWRNEARAGESSAHVAPLLVIGARTADYLLPGNLVAKRHHVAVLRPSGLLCVATKCGVMWR